MKFLSATLSAAALCGGMITAGCQDQMLSDGRIADNTAGVLGTSPEGLQISGRHGDATNTYYKARTNRGTFACVINGGGILAAGMVAPPSCNRI